jgi:hypothetical protein
MPGPDPLPLNQKKAIFPVKLTRKDGSSVTKYHVRLRKTGETKLTYISCADTEEEARVILAEYLATGKRPPKKTFGPGKGGVKREDGTFTTDPDEIVKLKEARKQRRNNYSRDRYRNGGDAAKKKKVEDNRRWRANNPDKFKAHNAKRWEGKERPKKAPTPEPPKTDIQLRIERVQLRNEVAEEIKDRTRTLLKRGQGESPDFITARAEDADLMRELIRDPRISVVTSGRFVRIKLG